MRLVVLGAATALAAFADFSYDSTSRVTGGLLTQLSSMPLPGMGEAKKALEPIVSRVAIKGDRMIHKSQQNATITDLAKETITTIDYKDKTYYVVTFAQMKEHLERMGREMSSKGKPDRPDVQLEFDIKETGRTQNFDGMSCREVILSTKMNSTDPKTGRSGSFLMNDVMWIAKSVPGEEEMKQFHMRMAQKMKIDPEAFRNMAAGGFGQGMAEMQKKAKAMEGTPIVQIVTVGASADGLPKSIDIPDTSEAMKRADEETARTQAAQQAANKAAMKGEVADAAAESGTQAAQTAVGNSLGKYSGIASGALGRFGGLGRKKAQQAQTEAPAAPPAAGAGAAKQQIDPGVMMQMRITDTGFSTGSVDSSIFDIPAGYTQTEHPMMKHTK